MIYDLWKGWCAVWLEQLKNEVTKANLLLPKLGLVSFTWGNVSAIDRESGLVIIKPSGVPYEGMSEEDMVVIDLDSNIIEGKWKPVGSSSNDSQISITPQYPVWL